MMQTQNRYGVHLTKMALLFLLVAFNQVGCVTRHCPRETEVITAQQVVHYLEEMVSNYESLDEFEKRWIVGDPKDTLEIVQVAIETLKNNERYESSGEQLLKRLLLKRLIEEEKAKKRTK